MGNKMFPMASLSFKELRSTAVLFRETLIKAFPAPDLRCEATKTPANPCASAGGSEEAMI